MKARITVVVLGHVDHGKSTLVGRYLFEKGLVHAEEIERYAKLGAELGKASFKYAWVMDRSDESRRRGLTLDLNYADVETRKREIHIIDAPGHKDFLRSMITGTTGADAALLVVDSQEGIMPQTREHAQLAKLMGVERVIVALNKIDRVGYRAEEIAKAASELKAMLADFGFSKVDIIPVSAWEGRNLTERGEPMAWYRGRTLEEALDSVEPRGAPREGSMRMPVMQVLTIGGVGTVILGRVERGTLKEGDELVVAPINKVGIVKSLEAYGKPIKKAEAGETVGIGLRNIARQDVERGDVLGSADDPPRLAEDFEAKIVLFGDVGVVKPGWSAHVHCHTAAVPVKLEAILMKYRPDSGEALEGQGAPVEGVTGKDRTGKGGTGKESQGAPGAAGGADAGEVNVGDGTGEAGAGYLMKGDAALVRFKPLRPLILESTEVLPGMARFALRAGKDTLGAGSCVSVRLAEKRLSTSDDKGFSYKWQKVGKGAKDQKARKDGERRDIWGKPLKKDN